jgi:O-acetyl-ADP-ribose deacetylase (regulator of RNase III)
MIRFREGDLFASGLAAIAHGVNCRGVMGAGIATQFRQRWPQMYESYRKRCLKGHLVPGDVMPWQHKDGFVFNLATQDKPGADAKPWAITAAVGQMISDAHYFYRDYGITEIGLPMIGCGIGGLCLNDLRRALAPYADAPVNLTVLMLAQIPPLPRCNYGHGSRDWCQEPAAWLSTWECSYGHLTYRRLCVVHDQEARVADVTGMICTQQDGARVCGQVAALISRTNLQR